MSITEDIEGTVPYSAGGLISPEKDALELALLLVELLLRDGVIVGY